MPRSPSEEPEGLVLRPELLTHADEAALLERLGHLRFDPIVMHGQRARRTARHYGLGYDYESRTPQPGEPVPDWLLPVRQRAADLAEEAPEALVEILVQRYPPGATIGWHRDAPAFHRRVARRHVPPALPARHGRAPPRLGGHPPAALGLRALPRGALVAAALDTGDEGAALFDHVPDAAPAAPGVALRRGAALDLERHDQLRAGQRAGEGFSATEDKAVHFHEVRAADGSRIEHRRICPKDGKQIDNDHIVKGYEVKKGEWVELTDDEIAAAAGPQSKLVDIDHFVPAGDIDPVFYERTYHLGADDKGRDAYALLHAALERSGRAGVGSWVFHNRERTVVVRAAGDVLAMHTMRFADDLADPGDFDLPRVRRKPGKREIDMASALVDGLHTDFDPADYEDT